MKSDSAYADICGAVIKQAIIDYRKLRFKSDGLNLAQRKSAWNDAHEFLFTDRLEKYLKAHGLSELVSVSLIRRMASA